jgi:uncharacterized membrane protein YdcZ (DUF606 family)
MLNFIQKLAAKPTDKTIRIVRVVFALILILVIVLGWEVTMTEFGLPEYIKYTLFVFPAIGLVRGIFDPGVFRKKIWKWTIVGIGVAMMIISLFLIEDKEGNTTIVPTTVSGEIDISTIIDKTEDSRAFTLSTDNWFGFFGFMLLLVGLLLNGKNITNKNERYGEKVTKIRV